MSETHAETVTGAPQERQPGAGEWVFNLPSLGADMESGTVLAWYAALGDQLERGDLVALVSTEKADIDVEIWQPGTVVEYLVDVGRQIPVGAPLLRLADVAAPATTATKPEPAAPATEPAAQVTTTTGEPATPVTTSAPTPPSTEPGPGAPAPTPEPGPAVATAGSVVASPFARTLARERGVDLATVTGTGPNGAVLARDLEALEIVTAPEQATAKRATGGRAVSMRQVIAKRMAKANSEIPHYHLEIDVDLGSALDRLQAHNAQRPVADRVLPAALLLKATAAAAASNPELNGYWIDDGFVPAGTVDLAVAVSLRNGGLVTPKISDVDKLDLDDVMTRLTELVAGARRGSLRSSWMADAGLTVTILGDQGVDRVNGVIFPPQVALVGFGRITDRPWVVDGKVTVRPVITVSLAADHRASDGATGSRFLNRLADHLETWEKP